MHEWNLNGPDGDCRNRKGVIASEAKQSLFARVWLAAEIASLRSQ